MEKAGFRPAQIEELTAELRECGQELAGLQRSTSAELDELRSELQQLQVADKRTLLREDAERELKVRMQQHATVLCAATGTSC